MLAASTVTTRRPSARARVRRAVASASSRPSVCAARVSRTAWRSRSSAACSELLRPDSAGSSATACSQAAASSRVASRSAGSALSVLPNAWTRRSGPGAGSGTLANLHRPSPPASEILPEADLAGHADLIRRNPAFEEVGQFLHVLQVHEGQRVRRAVERLEAEPGQPPVRDVLQVTAHVGQRQSCYSLASHSLAEQVRGELHLALHCLGQ